MPQKLKDVSRGAAEESVSFVRTKPSERPDGLSSLLGTEIDGRYVIDRIIGDGGMGIVYQARHSVIGKRVAIKVLRREYAKEKDAIDRFLLEAKAASSIGNPHIVDISDYGVLKDGSNYFVMELLEGENLGDRLYRARSLPLKSLLSIGRQLATGLAAAHTSGVIHRDLKPDNVFLVKRSDEIDFVKILDFGIAKAARHAVSSTFNGAIFGTPHYMSPEQARGQEVDPRADIYALGVILYEMATGNPPFENDDYMAVLSAHIHEPPKQLSEVVPGSFPVEVENLIHSCLEKEPSKRPSSMDELALALSQMEIHFFGASVESVTGDVRTTVDSPSASRLPALQGLGSQPRLPVSSTASSSKLPVASISSAESVLADATPGALSVPYSPLSSAASLPTVEDPRVPSTAPLTASRRPAPKRLMRWAPALFLLLTAGGVWKMTKRDSVTTAVAAQGGSVERPTIMVPQPGAETPRETLEVAMKRESVHAPRPSLRFTVEPADAHLYLDGKDLGTGAVSIQLGHSETAMLVVKKPGYVTETLRVDETSRAGLIRLIPMKKVLVAKKNEITGPFSPNPFKR